MDKGALVLFILHLAEDHGRTPEQIVDTLGLELWRVRQIIRTGEFGPDPTPTTSAPGMR